MFVTCPNCKTIHNDRNGLLCQICWGKVEKERGDKFYQAVMTSPARYKNIPMLAWQSLDKQTKVVYSYWNNAIHPGWTINVFALDKYFATRDDWKVYDSEEEAGQRVADLYEAFLRLQEKKK